MALDFKNTASTKTAKQRLQQAATANTKDKVLLVPSDKLSESPLNKSMPLENIDELAKSISEQGLQEPLLVYQKEDGTYEIYAGHRRFHALTTILNEKSVPCIIKQYPSDPEIRFKDHFTNNAERRENNFQYWLAEITAARDTLIDNGFRGSKRELVQAMSDLMSGKVSVAQIYRYEAVEKMDPSIQQLAIMGYSVYTLNGASSLNEKEQRELSRLAVNYSKVNEGELLRQKDFLKLIEDVKRNFRSTVPDKKAKLTADEKFNQSVRKAEDKIIKLFQAPKNDQQRDMALETVRRLKLKLEEIEQNMLAKQT